MADVTGPISTLPGAHYKVPAGTMCDDHPDVPAVARIQGETDSFGSEMMDLCQQCVTEFEAAVAVEDTSGCCDWCNQKADVLRPQRDYDEGSCGPVYQVCRACISKQNKAAEEELDRYAEEEERLLIEKERDAEFNKALEEDQRQQEEYEKTNPPSNPF